MPPKKGRKRRARERRHGEPGEAPPAAEAAPPVREGRAPAPASAELPKLRARMAGFLLAVVTVFFGILNIASGLKDGSLPILVTGVLLIALSIVLGVLALVPGRVRELLTRK